jgi:hypothetical protein
LCRLIMLGCSTLAVNIFFCINEGKELATFEYILNLNYGFARVQQNFNYVYLYALQYGVYNPQLEQYGSLPMALLENLYEQLYVIPTAM